MPTVKRKVGDWTMRIVHGHAELPAGMTRVPDGAFERCTELTSVTILDSVTAIGDSAFSGCSSLAAVTIPDTTSDIGFGINTVFPSTAEVTLWTAADYRRAGRWRRLRRWAWLAGWLAPRLRASLARAAERSYAPGGVGHQSAAADFAERAKVIG